MQTVGWHWGSGHKRVRGLSLAPLALMLRCLALLSLVFCAASSNIAHAAVWTATEPWSEAKERHYQEWISNSVDADFFTLGPWAGLETDCADAVYATRIIFAFENGLPFSTETKLKTSEGPLALNNNATVWDRISAGQDRVRAFIKAVNDVTWTGSLPRDTEAVEISPLSIVPGIMWLRPGHVELVKNIRSSGVVDLIGSTVPAAVRRLITVTDLGYIPDKATLGFRKWSWPALLPSSAPAALDPASALVRARAADCEARDNCEARFFKCRSTRLSI